VTYLIEYLGVFEFIFETVLGYVSGDQLGSFEAKKRESKISCLGTFKILRLDQYGFRAQHSFNHQLELLNQLRLRKQLTQRVSYSSLKNIQKSLIRVLNIIVRS
jgi:hypothetical protein